MRISDCAELTGTTVRTIRYYHQAGLLDVPGRVGGRRDYELEHVARIQRIRWLAEAGLSLNSIRTLLTEEGAESSHPSVRDLRETAAQIDLRIQELRCQRERITDLLVMAEAGQTLRALPAGLERFYDDLLSHVDDPHTRAGLLQERRLAEIMAQRGMVSPALTAVTESLTEDVRDVIIDFYTGYGRLPGLSDREAEAEIDRLVRLMDEWCTDNPRLVSQMFSALPSWALSPPVFRSMIALSTLMTRDRRQRSTMLRLTPILIDLAAHHAPVEDNS